MGWGSDVFHTWISNPTFLCPYPNSLFIVWDKDRVHQVSPESIDGDEWGVEVM